MTASGLPTRTADQIRAELLASVAPQAADEALLIELAATAASLTLQLGVAAHRLAEVLPGTLAEPKRALAVTKMIAELSQVGNTLVRRVEGALATAATLRIQRRVHERGPK